MRQGGKQADFHTEIFRIVSSKALDQGDAPSGPGPSAGIPLSQSTPPGDAKKGQCC